MHTVISNQPNDEATYWVGADVAKATFDAALVRPGQHYPATPLRAVPVDTFARNAEGVGQFLDWLAVQLRDVGAPVPVRMVMEATGQYSVELAGWLYEQCPALAPAIANPRQTKAYLASMQLRNKTDRVEARALAFYGLERRPAPYEVPSRAQPGARRARGRKGARKEPKRDAVGIQIAHPYPAAQDETNRTGYQPD